MKLPVGLFPDYIVRLLFALSLLLIVPGWSIAQKPDPDQGEESGEEIMAREQFLHDRRAGGPGMLIPRDAYATAAAEHFRLRKDREVTGSSTAATSWNSINPAGMFYAWTGTSHISGRTNVVAVHPTDPNTIYIGAAGGGVWKTTDGGSHWVPLTDNLTSNACGAVAIDPVTPTTIYFGTGELNYSIDSYYGDGIYKSTDAGSTWNKIATTSVGSRISQIVIDPTNTSIVYAAGSLGVYKSTNAGASWGTTASGTNANCLVMDPSNTQNLYITVGGTGTNAIKKSTNAGGTWTTLTSGLPASMNRTQLAIAASSPSTIYASITTASGAAVYRSTDAGATWSLRNSSVNYLGSQGWYDNAIAVDPSNANRVVVGGLDVYFSTDGGTTLTQKTIWYTTSSASFSHADIHYLGFSGGVLYCGSDGGVYKADLNAGNWVDLNGTLSTLQFQSADYDPSNTLRVYGGTQDNNLETTTDGGITWIQRETGDGGYCLVDPVTPNVVYGAYVNGSIKRSTDYGVSFTEISPNGSSGGLFYNPYEMAPGDHNTIIYAQADVWKTTSALTASPIAGWTQIAGTATVNGNVASIGISTSSTQHIYIGTSNGKILVTRDNGTTWATSTGFPYVTDLWVDQANDSVCYASCSGFTSGSHIFKTTNAGGSWNNITGTLPNVPVNSIAIKASPRSLFAGTDLGVYKSDDDGATWVSFNSGLPTVAVFDLKYKASNDLLLAATHGRGCFTFDLSTASVPRILVTPPNVAFGPVNTLGMSDSIKVDNTGSADLHVTSATTGTSMFTVTPSSATIIPGSSRQFRVSFSPSANGPVSDTATFVHDAAGSPTAVPVSGTGVSPSASITPAAVSVTVLKGDTTGRTLNVANPGVYGDLSYSIAIQHISPPSQPGIPRIGTPGLPSGTALHKPGTQTVESLKTDRRASAAGGPDAYGYFWKDSNQPGGPAFSWIEISGTGTVIPLTGDDVSAGTFPIGFTFPFYGTAFTSFYVCTNGFISFTPNSSQYQNTALPDGTAPVNLIAGLWDDLEVVSPKIYYATAGSKCIIEYQAVRRVGDPSTSFTFEIILNSDGRILLQYLSLTGDVTSCTAGIQNSDATKGLTVVANAAYLQNSLAVLIQRDWISSSPIAGSVTLGGNQNVALSFDATNLGYGSFTANLNIASNDPSHNPVVVPVSLGVVHLAGRDSINFGVVGGGSSKTDTVKLRNLRSVPVVVSSASSTNARFTVTPSSISIPAGDSAAFVVTFSPIAPGSQNGRIVFLHNAPSLSDTVVVTGSSAGSPGFTIAPVSIAIDSILLGNYATDTVLVSNPGTATLIVSSVTSTSPVFTVTPSTDTIPQSGSHRFVVTYTPVTVGSDTAALIFHTNTPETADTLTATGSSYATVLSLAVPLHSRWNLISNPVSAVNDSVPYIFPGGGQNFVYWYDTLAKRYIQVLRVETGFGYWLSLPADRIDTVTGFARMGGISAVRTGWNMVGSISVPVLVSSIVSDPPALITSKFFAYTTSYINADTLLPGKGYWVKVNGSGRLIMGIAAVKAQGGLIRMTATEELPPPPPDVVQEAPKPLPASYVLSEAEPNPFNPATTIRYQLPADSRVILRVYDLIGRTVATLTDGTEPAGYRSVVWNAAGMPSGIYFYRLEATSVSDPAVRYSGMKKMSLVK